MEIAENTHTNIFPYDFAEFTGTVWKLRKFALTLFWQKFRENNVFTKEITK